MKGTVGTKCGLSCSASRRTIASRLALQYTGEERNQKVSEAEKEARTLDCRGQTLGEWSYVLFFLAYTVLTFSTLIQPWTNKAKWKAEEPSTKRQNSLIQSSNGILIAWTSGNCYDKLKRTVQLHVPQWDICWSSVELALRYRSFFVVFKLRGAGTGIWLSSRSLICSQCLNIIIGLVILNLQPLE